MDETEYFYVSSDVLTLGTELRPWNPDPELLDFLKQMTQRGMDHLATAIDTDFAVAKYYWSDTPIMKTAFQELLLELERAENFPDRPPRIGSAMVFRTLQAAETFNLEYRGGQARLHVCRITQGIPFDTWMEWTSGGALGASSFNQIVAQKRARAAAYWRPDPPSTARYAETLVAGRVEVVRLLEM